MSVLSGSNLSFELVGDNLNFDLGSKQKTQEGLEQIIKKSEENINVLKKEKEQLELVKQTHISQMEQLFEVMNKIPQPELRDSQISKMCITYLDDITKTYPIFKQFESKYDNSTFISKLYEFINTTMKSIDDQISQNEKVIKKYSNIVDELKKFENISVSIEINKTENNEDDEYDDEYDDESDEEYNQYLNYLNKLPKEKKELILKRTYQDVDAISEDFVEQLSIMSSEYENRIKSLEDTISSQKKYIESLEKRIKVEDEENTVKPPNVYAKVMFDIKSDIKPEQQTEQHKEEQKEKHKEEHKQTTPSDILSDLIKNIREMNGKDSINPFENIDLSNDSTFFKIFDDILNTTNKIEQISKMIKTGDIKYPENLISMFKSKVETSSNTDDKK